VAGVEISADHMETVVHAWVLHMCISMNTTARKFIYGHSKSIQNKPYSSYGIRQLLWISRQPYGAQHVISFPMQARQDATESYRGGRVRCSFRKRSTGRQNTSLRHIHYIYPCTLAACLQFFGSFDRVSIKYFRASAFDFRIGLLDSYGRTNTERHLPPTLQPTARQLDTSLATPQQASLAVGQAWARYIDKALMIFQGLTGETL